MIFSKFTILFLVLSNVDVSIAVHPDETFGETNASRNLQDENASKWGELHKKLKSSCRKICVKKGIASGLPTSPRFCSNMCENMASFEAPTCQFSVNNEGKDSLESLHKVLGLYICDPSPTSVVAKKYGYPINQWDVSCVEDFYYMFSYHSSRPVRLYCPGFTAEEYNTRLNVNISDWDVSSVTDMAQMFHGSELFNQDISKWDTSSVTSMYGMFNGADMFDQDIGNWNVGSVTTMRAMFAWYSKFNKDISNWDVSAVENMRGMFGGSPFNQDLSKWDVNRVTAMDSMFGSATAFNQDISMWRINNLLTVNAMFQAAGAFNQDLCNWAQQIKVWYEPQTYRMFEAPNCETQSDPRRNWTTRKIGPFCHVCN